MAKRKDFEISIKYVPSVDADERREEGLRMLAVFIARKIRREAAEKLKETAASFGSEPPREAPAQRPESPRRLLDVDGLATYLSLPKSTIYTWVSTKRIPANAIVRLGRALRFDIKEIDAWVDQRRPT